MADPFGGAGRAVAQAGDRLRACGDAARFEGAGRDRVQQFDVGSGDRLVVLGGADGGVEHPQPLAGGVQLVSFGASTGAGCRAGQCNPGA